MIAVRSRDVPTLLLGALALLAPFAVDVSLPGLPTIATALHAPGGLMQWTLSAYVLATGVGQLVWGPISDRYGRRPVIVIGLVLYAMSALGCAAVHDVVPLILLRFVQGIGACAGYVCAVAIVQDLPLPENERVSRQATIGSVTNIGPLVAPVAGVAILELFGWRALYATPALLGLGALAAVIVLLPETSPRMAGTALERYRRVLALPRAIPYAWMVFLFFAGYFAMIGGSPFVLVSQFHLNPTQFAVAFTLEALCALLGSFAASRLALRIAAQPLLAAAVTLGAAAAIANAITGVALVSAVAYIVTMSVLAFAFGVALPTAYAIVLADAGPDAGVASGVLGAALSFGGAVGGTISGALPFAPTVRIGLVAAVAVCAAALSYRLAPRPNGSPAPIAEP